MEMRKDLQMFCFLKPDGESESCLTHWLNVVDELLLKETFACPLLYYKIHIISSGLGRRLRHVRDAVRRFRPTGYGRAYFETLHDSSGDHFEWNGFRVDCIQDAINLAVTQDHNCCILPTSELRDVTEALENFACHISGRYAILPPHLYNRHPRCLLCESDQINNHRINGNNMDDHCHHGVRITAPHSFVSRRDASCRRGKITDFWSVFCEDDCSDDATLAGESAYENDDAGDNYFIEMFPCKDIDLLPWTGTYGVDPWDTIDATCRLAKRHASSLVDDSVAKRTNNTNSHVDNLLGLQNLEIMSAVERRQREYVDMKFRRVRQRIDIEMTELNLRMARILVPCSVSDDFFGLLHSLRQTVENRNHFLHALSSPSSIIHPAAAAAASATATRAKLGHVSLELGCLFLLEEAAFELVVSPRTWQKAKHATAPRFAVLANAEFAHSDPVVRAQTKGICQFRSGNFVPKNVKDIFDWCEKHHHDELLDRYAFFANAALLVYALGRATGIDVHLTRPEFLSQHTGSSSPILYLNPADDVPAALYHNGDWTVANDVLHIVGTLLV